MQTQMDLLVARVEHHLQQSSLAATNAVQKLHSLQEYVMGLNGEMQLQFRQQHFRDGKGGESGHLIAPYLDLLETVLTGMVASDGAQSSVGIQPFDPLRRSLGRDWPVSACTMIGERRMRNLRNLLELAIQQGVPGDFIETGVWRGGACIYAKAIFDAHGKRDRHVFVADSFRGLPPPDAAFPDDAGDTHHTYDELAVSQKDVAQNFRRFGLLDERVVFIEGWFKDTLPTAPVDQLCVLRLDGDLYESTIVALEALYHKVSSGGYVIIDDYLLPPCAKAVNDFRSQRGITAPMHEVDGAAVWWQVQ